MRSTAARATISAERRAHVHAPGEEVWRFQVPHPLRLFAPVKTQLDVEVDRQAHLESESWHVVTDSTRRNWRHPSTRPGEFDRRVDLHDVRPYDVTEHARPLPSQTPGRLPSDATQSCVLFQRNSTPTRPRRPPGSAMSHLCSSRHPRAASCWRIESRLRALRRTQQHQRFERREHRTLAAAGPCSKAPRTAGCTPGVAALQLATEVHDSQFRLAVRCQDCTLGIPRTSAHCCPVMQMRRDIDDRASPVRRPPSISSGSSRLVR